MIRDKPNHANAISGAARGVNSSMTTIVNPTAAAQIGTKSRSMIHSYLATIRRFANRHAERIADARHPAAANASRTASLTAQVPNTQVRAAEPMCPAANRTIRRCRTARFWRKALKIGQADILVEKRVLRELSRSRWIDEVDEVMVVLVALLI